MVQEKATIEMIQNVIKGVTPVQTALNANRASADEDGNNIPATYARRRARLFLCKAVHSYSTVYYAEIVTASGDDETTPEPTSNDFMLVIETEGGSYAIGDIFQVYQASAPTPTKPQLTASFGQKVGNIFGGSRYAVGDYYITEGANSPAEQYGGTWTRVQGQFIFGSDSSHAVGSEGGAETVTLTEDEMPTHKHTTTDGSYGQFLYIEDANGNYSGRATVKSNSGADSSFSFRPVTETAGNSQPHNNMPPYRAVNIWRRVS